MGVADKISSEIVGWGVVGITVVLVSIILLNFKTVSVVTASLNSTVDTFVSAFSEPKNWVAIVIIAIIGISLLSFFTKKGKGGRF